METTKKSRKKSAPLSAERLAKAYRDHVLTEGKRPATVFKFCKDLGITENEFYEQFGSFDGLEKSIWQGYLKQTIKRLQSDKNFAGFSCREQILAFYYTLTDTLKEDRSFVLNQWKEWKNPAALPGFLRTFRKDFDQWIKSVLAQGKQSGEIATRPYLDDRYDHLFWLHLMFTIQFWSQDDSPGFEKTDVAIEKSVNLAFDLVGKGVLDNALDFGKFLYQNSKN